MPKIENWSRRQDLEGGHVKKVWENDNTSGDYPQFLAVRRRENSGYTPPYEVGLWSSEQGIMSDQTMPDRRVQIGDNSNGLYSDLNSAEEDAKKWMDGHKGNVDLQVLDPDQSIGKYSIGDYTSDKLEYVGEYSGDEDADFVIIQLMKQKFRDRDPVYSIDGLILRDGEGVVTDFRPTTDSQFSDPREALDTLESVVISYDPEDAVMDERDRL